MNAGKPKVTLVATAPDGSEISIRTAAGYDWAGVAKRNGSWVLLAKGWAYGSVAARTQTAWRRAGGWDDEAGPWYVVEFKHPTGTDGDH